MHTEVSPEGTTTTYLVQVGREQAAEIIVELPGSASPEGRAEARRVAQQRLGAGEAVAWAAIGDPIVFDAEPIEAAAA